VTLLYTQEDMDSAVNVSYDSGYDDGYYDGKDYGYENGLMDAALDLLPLKDSEPYHNQLVTLIEELFDITAEDLRLQPYLRDWKQADIKELLDRMKINC
jgi:hypothetical protein